ncbi:MAG TPA: class I SAM-dependent methyltransferase [Arcobacter sp.]|nr:class I SAM-dependent methyltransferase [Arcobacter sp.]
MSFLTFRRYYLDDFLISTSFSGMVLDIGGKKDNKRGKFRPPLNQVDSWEYLNIDEDTNPDYLCSADSIPVEDEHFDMVLLCEVLEHLENPEEVLNEAQRVLKKGGRVIISMPFLNAIHADPYDYQRWTDFKFQAELKKSGFSNIDIVPMGSVFAVIYDILYVASSNRFYRKLFLYPLSLVFRPLDRWVSKRVKKINTGYFINATK